MRTKTLAGRALALVAVIAVSLAVASPAAGDETGGNKLRFQGGGAHAWVAGNDSPTETDNKYLALDPEQGQYVAVFTTRSSNLNTDATQLHNLSFNVSTDTLAHSPGGDPRISVIFQSGDVAFLDSHFCAHAIGVSGGTWKRSDFTGFTSNCAFNVSGGNDPTEAQGGFTDQTCTVPATVGATQRWYCAGGGHSAWANFAADNPDANVAYDFFIVDLPRTDGQPYQIDDLTLGTGKIYTKSNYPTRKCPSESSC